MANKLGMNGKAYELYLRTARLDLDDYNNEVHEGCHITSMAGSWLAVVEGFGGMRVIDGRLYFNPRLPAAWGSLEFTVFFRKRRIRVCVEPERTAIELIEGDSLVVGLNGEDMTLQNIT